jgi:hypothetical protein
MNPFRKNVLVLFGAALLIALSVGSALGAKPTSSDAAGPRGQTISDFVHSVLAGDQEVTVDETPTDETPADDCTTDEATTSDEGATDEGATADEDTTSNECATDEDSNDEETAPADEDTNEDASTDANAHGKCVSEIAQNPDEIGGDNENHGGAVSLAARETCWEDTTGAEDTAADIQAEVTARETAAAERAAAKEAREAERATAREARETERAASVHGKSGTHGGGHGD